MLERLRKYPFVGMLATLVAGILLSYLQPQLPLPTLLTGCIIVLTGLFLIGCFLPKSREVLWGLTAAVFLFAFGLWNTHHSLEKSEWTEQDSIPVTRKVQVLQTPVERAKTWQMPVRLASDKQIILYLQKDSALTVPQAGDWLLVKAKISQPKPADEYSFDYMQYLRLQGMAGTAYVPKGGMLIVGHDNLRGLMPAMRRIRDQIEALFMPFRMRERSVLEALLLGDRRRLSEDTRAAFAASGAMHVLAVSGLHVGIIAEILLWLVTLGGHLMPRYEDKTKRYLQAAIVVAALIFYALLTGLSPSVCRSVLMFSLLTFGRIINPLRSRYNEVAASAFIILLFNPIAILQSGFLLSYSAVLAIIRFYPSLQIHVKNRLLRGLWDLIAVSLCAQIGTLPWTIYFFHRISNYFILTNLGILPLVQFLLIPTFFILLPLARIPLLGPFIGQVLEGETWLMNEYTAWIQALPGSSSELCLNGWLTAILVALVVCWMLRTRWRWLISAALTVAFIITLLYDYRAATNEQDLRTYERRPDFAVMAREGRQMTLLATDSAFAMSATHNYRLARHIRQTTFLPIDTTKWYIGFRWQEQPYTLRKTRKGYLIMSQPM